VSGRSLCFRSTVFSFGESDCATCKVEEPQALLGMLSWGCKGTCQLHRTCRARIVFVSQPLRQEPVGGGRRGGHKRFGGYRNIVLRAEIGTSCPGGMLVGLKGSTCTVRTCHPSARVTPHACPL
jgi:hypothetical protein